MNRSKKNKIEIMLRNQPTRPEPIERTIAGGFFLVLMIMIIIIIFGYAKDLQAEYTKEEFHNRISETISPYLNDPQPARDLFQNLEEFSGYRLFTSYDWPGEICRTKVIDVHSFTECKKIGEKNNEEKFTEEN